MKTKQKFIIGEEWLYYKIYCGVKTADLLLIETIKPLINQLLNNQQIDQWFFIRYKDPEPHIRLRFHFNDITKIAFVINAVKENLKESIENQSIHKIQIDTYNRELFRYGRNAIEFAETLFYNDSECITSALQLIENEDLLLLFTLKNTTDLIHSFGLNDEEFLAFVNQQMRHFKEEFKVDKKANKQLLKKYNERKKDLTQFLTNLNKINKYKPLNVLLKLKNKNDIFAIHELSKQNNLNTIKNKLSSFIHMSINRSFRSKQRLYEMLCYDFLVRYYKSKIARKKYDV